MKLFRYRQNDPANNTSPAPNSATRLGIETDAGRFDLTGFDPALGTLLSWLTHDAPLDLVRQAVESNGLLPLSQTITLLAPIDAQEVWASGVTYLRSKVARMEESVDGGDFYDRVYQAERPELFFKALPRRVVGPGMPIRIRHDSTWDVPEPEMTLLLNPQGHVIGVTVGNDVSSRSIEGENPLYLPQAKSYEGSCALGPVIALPDETMHLTELPIHMTIERGGATVFAGETNTNQMKRHPRELVEYLLREMVFPDGVFLMTGTGLVPPDTFTLQSGDRVSITIDGIGTLTNPVA